MNPGNSADLELLSRTAQGDGEAFRMLYERYSGRIFSFVIRYTADYHEAEEIVQETFLRLHRKADSFKPSAKFSTWLFQIAMNLCRDRGRRLPRRAISSEGIPEKAVSAGPLDDLRQAEAKEIIEEVLKKLPDEERSVLLLRLHEDLTFDEIATIVGRSERTVRERMKQARKKFLEELERWDHALAEVLGHGLF